MDMDMDMDMDMVNISEFEILFMLYNVSVFINPLVSDLLFSVYTSDQFPRKKITQVAFIYVVILQFYLKF